MSSCATWNWLYPHVSTWHYDIVICRLTDNLHCPDLIEMFQSQCICYKRSLLSVWILQHLNAILWCPYIVYIVFAKFVLVKWCSVYLDVFLKISVLVYVDIFSSTFSLIDDPRVLSSTPAEHYLLFMQSCWSCLQCLCDYLCLLKIFVSTFIVILCFFIVQVLVRHSDCFSGVCMPLSSVSNAHLEWYYADYSCVY